MAKDVDKIRDQLFSLTVGLDYDQPTSLESDLDMLGDLLTAEGFCPEGFKPTAKSGYLAEVIAKVVPPRNELEQLRELCSKIAAILGNVEYCGLEEGDAEELESLVDEFVDKFKTFLNGIP